MRALFLRAAAAWLRRGTPARPVDLPENPRLLVIRRNRMGDMLCTLPLLQALRRQYPKAHLAVACDPTGVPIARACAAVDRVIPLRRASGWNRRVVQMGQARQMQDFDVVIAAKAGFDLRLAQLARLTNAPRRIGYDKAARSAFYTDPVSIPADLWRVHQVEAALALLAPLGIAAPADPMADLALSLPESALAFAEDLAPFWKGRRLVLVNVSGTSPIRFRNEDFASLVAELAAHDDLAVGMVGLPADLPGAERLAAGTAGRARVLSTPGPMELAALLARALVLVTAEGGAAHLAAVVRTPAVVLWSEGPFEKWHSRGPRHAFIRLEQGAKLLSPDHVRAALAPLLEARP